MHGPMNVKFHIRVYVCIENEPHVHIYIYACVCVYVCIQDEPKVHVCVCVFLSYLTGARYVHPCWLLRAPDKRFSHTLDSFGRWPRPASSFRSAQAATVLEFHVPLTNCFVRRWFCAVHGPKPLLHRHNWLSFGKFQDTERFLIHCARHYSSRLPPSGGTCKYAKVPSTKKLWEIVYLVVPKRQENPWS